MPCATLLMVVCSSRCVFGVRGEAMTMKLSAARMRRVNVLAVPSQRLRLQITVGLLHWASGGASVLLYTHVMTRTAYIKQHTLCFFAGTEQDPRSKWRLYPCPRWSVRQPDPEAPAQQPKQLWQQHRQPDCETRA